MSKAQCNTPDPHRPTHVATPAPEVEEIVSAFALPVIRQVLRSRLGFHLNEQGHSSNPDAEDLTQDVLHKVLVQWTSLTASPDQAQPHNWGGLVREIAENVCTDYIRRQNSQWQSLKNQLRVILRHHPELSQWKDEKEDWWCGLAGWREAKQGQISPENLVRLKENPLASMRQIFPHEDMSRLALPRLVGAIFQVTGGALKFDDLVTIIAHLRGIKDVPPVSYDDLSNLLRERLAEPRPSVLNTIEGAQSLQQFWLAARRLPFEQCRSLLLKSKDPQGNDIPSLLLEAGIATLEEMAQALNFPLEKFIEIWHNLPLRDREIAALCGATHEQVTKWRSRALMYIKKLGVIKSHKK